MFPRRPWSRPWAAVCGGMRFFWPARWTTGPTPPCWTGETTEVIWDTTAARSQCDIQLYTWVVTCEEINLDTYDFECMWQLRGSVESISVWGVSYVCEMWSSPAQPRVAKSRTDLLTSDWLGFLRLSGLTNPRQKRGGSFPKLEPLVTSPIGSWTTVLKLRVQRPVIIFTYFSLAYRQTVIFATSTVAPCWLSEELLHWLHFSDPRAISVVYTVRPWGCSCTKLLCPSSDDTLALKKKAYHTQSSLTPQN